MSPPFQRTSVTVVLKKGPTLIGTLWRWRPGEGWFSLTACPAPGADRIEFGACTSIRTGDKDLLRAARDDGWKGV